MSSKVDQKSTFTREDRDFESKGVRCAGWLYRPEGISRPPVVVMAHGFTAVRAFGLPTYAERLAERGMAVYLFDYRTFGDSDGEPRNLANPRHHIQDWEAAIAYVRSLSDVDTDKVALWGTSYSGGHVIVVASRDPRIKAIVSQVPFVDGITASLRLGIMHFMKCSIPVTRDILRILTFRKPYYLPIVGEPGELVVLSAPDVLSGYMSIIPEGVDFVNEIPARCLLELLLYRPIASAAKVKCPTLFIAGDKDSLGSPRMAEKAASRIPKVNLIHLDAGHFDVYSGELFERLMKMQGDFLSRYLLEE
jgi:uncharacterized protein